MSSTLTTAEADSLLSDIVLEAMFSTQAQLQQVAIGDALVLTAAVGATTYMAMEYFRMFGTRDGWWTWLYVYVYVGLVLQLGCALVPVFLLPSHASRYVYFLRTDMTINVACWINGASTSMLGCQIHFAHNAYKLWGRQRWMAALTVGLISTSFISGAFAAGFAMTYPFPSVTTESTLAVNLPLFYAWFKHIRIANAVWMTASLMSDFTITGLLMVGIYRLSKERNLDIDVPSSPAQKIVGYLYIPPTCSVVMMSGFVLSGSTIAGGLRVVSPLVASTFTVALFQQLISRDKVRSRIHASGQASIPLSSNNENKHNDHNHGNVNVSDISRAHSRASAGTKPDSESVEPQVMTRSTHISSISGAKDHLSSEEAHELDIIMPNSIQYNAPPYNHSQAYFPGK